MLPLGATFREAWTAMSATLPLLVGLTLACYAPMVAFDALTGEAADAGNTWLSFASSCLLSVLSAWSQTASLSVIQHWQQHGRKPSFTEINPAPGRWLAMLGLQIVISIAIVLLLFLLLFALLVIIGGTSDLMTFQMNPVLMLTSPYFLLSLALPAALALALLTLWILSPASIIAGRGVFTAIGESARLVRRSFWKVLLLVVPMLLLSYGGMIGLIVIAPEQATTFRLSIAAAISAVLFLPLSYALIATVYRRLAVREEARIGTVFE